MPSRFVTVLRWILLLIAVVLLVPGLCTVFPVPHWIGWQQRLAVTGLIGETGYRYLLVPAVITILAAALPSRKTWLAVTSFGCGLLALTLWAKPLVQAWAIGVGPRLESGGTRRTRLPPAGTAV